MSNLFLSIINMTFGTKLHKLREQNRLSQQEVADLIGVSQNTYSRWESDIITFKIEYLPKLAEVFKVEPTELIPQGTTVKIVNSGNQKIDNSIVGFEINMDARELYRDLLASKDEVIRLLKEENDRLKRQAYKYSYKKKGRAFCLTFCVIMIFSRTKGLKNQEFTIFE